MRPRKASEQRVTGAIREYDLGDVDAFPEMSVRCIQLGSRREIALVRWKGEQFYALHNRCPHQGGPLCRGSVGPKLISADRRPGELRVEDDAPVLACPWHHWEFDVRSGDSVFASRYHLKTYSVSVEDGKVLLRLRRG